MFYPQLVAGPIERPQNLLPQFRVVHNFDLARMKEGLLLMVWGFFKKVCIADRIGSYVDDVYGDPMSATGTEALLAIYFYAFQIYCDFSGYSDIAIGSANVMGFNLAPNFNRPYAAQSLADFWKRWHISLSSWFRDYVYIPLGGNRQGIKRQLVNIFITFTISGLWHGAHWNFVFWGAFHALFLIGGYLLNIKKQETTRAKYFQWIKMLATFHLVALLWVVFRAQTLGQAIDVVKALGHRWPLKMPFGQGFETFIDLVPAIPLIIMMLFMEWKHGANPIMRWQQGKALAMRWAMVWGIIFLILNFGAFTKGQSFIYFQF
jgi:D-alanyl-lipoteichoic acid acyltransferase DltB (MBOAT superfamily)